MLLPACDQQQYAKSCRLVARAGSAEDLEEDVVNECREYARMGCMRCEPLSDEEVHVLLKG